MNDHATLGPIKMVGSRSVTTTAGEKFVYHRLDRGSTTARYWVDWVTTIMM